MKILTTILSALILTPAMCIADNRQDQTGEIALEAEAEVSPYKKTQDGAIEKLKVLDRALQELAKGSLTSVEDFKEAELSYLTAVYLHCSIQNGTCPEIPEALLELDLIKAQQNSKVDCTNSLAFWNLWLKNDMESRQKYEVKTGYLKKTEEFVRNVRPKYIKCKQTVNQEINNGAKGSKSNFFVDRYKNQVEKLSLASSLLLMLEDIKAKYPNIFVTVGANKAEKKK